MRTKLIKVVSLLLTISLLAIASVAVVNAASAVSAPLGIENSGPVSGKVTVSIVCNESISYALEGIFDLADSTGYITLESIDFGTEDLDDFTKTNESTGKISWIDYDFDGNAAGEGFVIVTATYNVAADTPAGDYTLSFKPTVYMGADGEIVKNLDTITTTVEVEVNDPATGLKGDVDLDGDVGPSDLTALAKHLAEIEFITDATAINNADVTGDAEIGPDDLTKLAQYLAEIIDSLE